MYLLRNLAQSDFDLEFVKVTAEKDSPNYQNLYENEVSQKNIIFPSKFG